MALVCVLDDDRVVRRLIAETASEQGHEILAAATLAEGLALCESRPVDVVFLDIYLPDGNGLDIIPRLRDLPSRPEIVIVTGRGDPEGAELAIRHGAWDYLAKPLLVDDLLLILNRVVAFRSRREGPIGRSRIELPGIIGESRALRGCLEQVAQAAGSDVNVLVLGETGTGKELFSRAIHDHSPRASGPFVPVDCASITESLLEDRMFGHVRGAFTGADGTREGLVRQAHGGTLFLDEIGELPLPLQRSFLRVLETRRFRPIGSTREVESDFRLVAATNRNLREMADLGLFRPDLLYRLQGATITLPPLRERREDIGSICRHYLAELCQSRGECGKEMSDDFLDVLAAYDWPGNVRELVHALEWAFAATRGEPVVFAGHLPVDIRMAVAKARLRKAGDGEQPHDARPRDAAGAWPCPDGDGREGVRTFREFRDMAERSYLSGLLARAPNMTEAARLSGLSRGHLYQLLKKHGLD